MNAHAPPPDRLPAQLTTFVGRERDIGEVRALLRRSRLVTIAGTAGLGKSRLAIEVASRARADHPGGAWFAGLASLVDPALIDGQVATALGINVQPGEEPSDAVVAVVGGRRLLLVLDNCEHLLDGCARLVERLLGACAGLHIVATSHEPLRVAGEQVWRLAPLTLPRRGAQAPVESDAVRLFEARARLVQPQFAITRENADAVARLCRRLDGIPLAIELAAARTEMMSVDDLLERIEDRFRLLTGGSRTAMPRHRTLRAALDWGHHLLNDEERKLFRRLSVFSGSFDEATAADVCTSSDFPSEDVPVHLARLVDKSLLLLDASAVGAARYRMLETIRQYAAEKLWQSGDEAATASQHADHCLVMATEASAFQRRQGQAEWLERLEAAHDDARAALRWCRANDPARCARLALALAWFWLARGHLAEGREWLTIVLATPSLGLHDRAMTLQWLCHLGLWRGDYEAALELGEQSLAGFRESGDEVAAGWTLDLLGTIHGYAGDDAAARNRLNEVLLTAEDEELRINAATSLGELLLLQRDVSGAREVLERAVAAGGPEARWNLPMGLVFLAVADLLEGDDAGCRRRLQDVMEALDQAGNRFAMGAALYLAAALALLSDNQPARALRLCGAADALRERLRTPLAPAWRQLVRTSLVEPARAAVPAETAVAAWAEGARLSYEEAVALALGETPPPAPPLEVVAGLDCDPGPLSRREREVALLTARGFTNRQIAERLVIAERTVEGHLERIRSKLGVNSRTQIAVWVVERGWLAG